jgi:hypothetical protein
MSEHPQYALDMNLEKLEAEIESHLERLSNLDLSKLANLEKLLLKEFQDNDDGVDYSIWTDVFRDHLESIEDRLVKFKEFRDFLINIGKVDTHIVCGAFYLNDLIELWTPEQLDKVADLPLCEEDSGRTDSCFGAHFFVAINPNVSERTLRKLLKTEHYDEGFFPWLVARSKSSSPKLLSEIADKFNSITTWRAFGEYNTELSVLETNRNSFVLWQIKNNSNTAKVTLNRFNKEIKELETASEEELELLIKQTRVNYSQKRMNELKTFIGETSHLDHDFLIWLERFYTSAPLLDDPFEDYDALQYENDESFKQLQNLWIAGPNFPDTNLNGNQGNWELAGVRLPIEKNRIKGLPQDYIDFLFVEVEPAKSKSLLSITKKVNTVSRWKISVIKVGAKEEYNRSELLESLAWKMMVVASGQEVPLSKIIGEIYWSRYQEIELPFNSPNEGKIGELANAYIARGSK